MPIVSTGHRVPGPIRALAVDEYDSRSGIFLVGIRPHIIVAPRRSRFGAPGALKPRMLVGRVIHHEFGDYSHTARVRLPNEQSKVGECAVVGMNAAVLTDVVAVVQTRRWIKR